VDTRAPLRRIADPLSPVFEKLLTEHAPDAVAGEIAEPRRGDGQRARASCQGGCLTEVRATQRHVRQKEITSEIIVCPPIGSRS
jgi:hypothetical protein